MVIGWVDPEVKDIEVVEDIDGMEVLEEVPPQPSPDLYSYL